MVKKITLPPNTGVMLCGHGSRNKLAVDEFANLSKRLQNLLPNVPVEYGYLEFANPVIHLGLDKLRQQGVKNVLAIPGMLFAAGHAKNDIPSVLNTYAAKHDDFSITYGRELGIDLKMMRAAGDRIKSAHDEANEKLAKKISAHDSMLMLVGRGSSDVDANSNVTKVMRNLWEGLGFGWGETAYSGVTFPLVSPALDRAVRLGFKRIIIFPYFLFTGVLVKRIYAAVDEAAKKYPEIEFVKAPYLSDHDLVLETFIERIDEILHGQNLMNCSLCKYREQVLGFEDEVGAKQESHHHHVEGIGGGLENCPCKGDCDASCRDEEFCKKHNLPFTPLHSHDHGHEHSHDHHHPIYPHADHPLGPVTLKKK